MVAQRAIIAQLNFGRIGLRRPNKYIVVLYIGHPIAVGRRDFAAFVAAGVAPVSALTPLAVFRLPAGVCNRVPGKISKPYATKRLELDGIRRFEFDAMER